MSENAKAAKQQRLAQALRANLKRRKEAAGRSAEEIGLPRTEEGEPRLSLTGATGEARNKD